ncbi:hypothetical protein QEN19_001415 [Hanseniaspora menglaensis]
MKAAPKGRRHSKRKNLKRLSKQTKAIFKWPSIIFTHLNSRIFCFNNKLYDLHRLFGKNDNINKTTSEVNLKPERWYKKLFYKLFGLEKKKLPLVVVGIHHDNNFITSNPAVSSIKKDDNRYRNGVKVEYYKKNKLNVLKLSKREHKFKRLTSKPYEDLFHEHNFQPNAKSIKIENNIAKLLNQIEKKHIISKQLPSQKLDVHYNLFYGTNTLKAICLSEKSTSSKHTAISTGKLILLFNIGSEHHTSSSDSEPKILELNETSFIVLPNNSELYPQDCSNFKTTIRKHIKLKYDELKYNQLSNPFPDTAEDSAKNCKNKYQLSNVDKKTEKFDAFEKLI